MEIRSSSMLKPSYSSPHPLAGQMVPLTIFDRAAFDDFVPIVLAFHAPTPTNEELKDGLLKAVAQYPHFAGRTTGDGRNHRYIHLNNEGFLFVEADVSADLADALGNGWPDNVNELYPAAPKENTAGAVLQVKLNRYKCGGLVIGATCHHEVADGHSSSTFVAMWASAVRAGPDFAPLSPFLDRGAAAVPRGTRAPVFDHRSIEFKGGDNTKHKSYAVVPIDKIKNLTVHFTEEFITNLQAHVGAPSSTFACLLAHVWKKITAARGLNQEEFTQVRVAVNCRDRAKPPMPTNFFGNMVLWAFPRFQVRDLLSSNYSSVVRAISHAVARVDAEYIQSFVDFGAVADGNGEELVPTAPVLGTMFCPDLEVDSWLGFEFHKLDFGRGPPFAFRMPTVPIEGLMIFVPSCAAKGGVDLFLNLAEDHVEAFQHICYSLDSMRRSSL